MLTFVRDEVKPDLFFWTGDNSPHNVWANSIPEVGNATLNITIAIQKVLDSSNITVYPIQGNHDTWPVNVQDFSSPNINEPINGFSASWAKWLDSETLMHFQEYGYYSTELKLKDGRVFPKTKILGINTQACNNMNWELLKNRYDPGNEVEWLQGELEALEAINGTAILITHIPTNGDCLHGWGHRLRGLMERYQHIIRFGLFGHTHDEEYSIVQAVSDSKNIAINFIAPSVTPYTDKYPSFTLVEIDEEFMVPVNFKIYYYSLEKA
jgi:sphingomyelin phosphodiesterase